MAKEDAKTAVMDPEAAFKAECEKIAKHDGSKLVGPVLKAGETIGERGAVITTPMSEKNCKMLFRQGTSKWEIKSNGAEIFRTQGLPLGKTKGVWSGTGWVIS